MLETNLSSIQPDPPAPSLQTPPQPQAPEPDLETPNFAAILNELIEPTKEQKHKTGEKDSLTKDLPAAAASGNVELSIDSIQAPAPSLLEEGRPDSRRAEAAAWVPDDERSDQRQPAAPLPLDLENFEVNKIKFTLEPVAVEPEKQRLQLLRLVVVPPSLAGNDGPTSQKQRFLQDSSPVAGENTISWDHPTHFEIAKPEPVQQIRSFVEPPPPPPVARQVSMDVGDADSQVRIVIRERNGELDIRFDAATERLRRDLETAAPLLVSGLERESRMHVADLDFTRFGSATDSDRQNRQHAHPKKSLKQEAVFADLDETTYLEQVPAPLKSL